MRVNKSGKVDEGESKWMKMNDNERRWMKVDICE